MARSKPKVKGGDRRDGIVRLGLVQHACPPGAAPARNLARAMGMIREAAGRGAQIVATQELFTSHYFCQVESDANFKLAEVIPGPTTRELCGLAGELGIYLLASLFEKRAQGIFHNTAVMIDGATTRGRPGRIISKYRKMHIPDDPRFFEKYYFTPGDAPASGGSGGSGVAGVAGAAPADTSGVGWQMQETRHARTGVLICWDQWYPEAARLTALRGAQVLFYPTAIGWYHKETPADRAQQKDAWQTIQRSHAIANGIFVAAINRVGVEGELEFWGSSFICDPGGVVLAQASGAGEEVLVADCDLRRIDEVRQGWPFLRDRRVDAYGDMVRRYVD